MILRLLYTILSLAILSIWPAMWGEASEAKPIAYVLSIEGVIGPATSDYLERSLSQAEAQQAELVVLRIDTPGGLDIAMRAIVKRLLAATVPVIAYVAPSGARAASAGTYILYASNIAAMAPGTNIGAATPIELSGWSGTETSQQKPDTNSGPESTTGHASKPNLDDAHQSKLINDAAAYLQSLARLRHRNATWAEQAVFTAASLTAEQAQHEGVVELLAVDIDALLHSVDGKVVTMPDGKPRTLHTANIEYEVIEPDWGNRFLAAVSDPTIAYILLMLGIYGLIFEFANPGFLLPGTAGAIFLLLAFYSLQMLEVDYVGLAFIFLGLLLMLAETFMPSFGTLGVGGIVAFVFGSLILIDTSHGISGVSLPLVIAMAIVSAGIVLGIVNLALRAHRRPIMGGKEELLGSVAVVIEDWSTNEGTVRVRGELWSARAEEPLHCGQSLTVVGRDGLFLLLAANTAQLK